MTEKVYELFGKLNSIPRPSHHEEKVSDFLCQYAESLGLEYDRDKENCVVIRKPATPGHEDAEPIVLLNHMDMVAVGDGSRDFNPLNDSIKAYVENGWMKARGTSLGADNGIGLSMALAVLADDSIVHGPLEVLTTTNEEDGMSGAAAMSTNFIRGRKVINLDSEDYDTITVGAAGAYLQIGKWNLEYSEIPEDYVFRKISMSGGLGGHSGVDINKGRCNCIKELANCLSGDFVSDMMFSVCICALNGGTANASIASCAEIDIAMKPEFEDKLNMYIADWNKYIQSKYATTDPHVKIEVGEAKTYSHHIQNASIILRCIYNLSCGVMKMREDMPGTVMTSNNIGMLTTTQDCITLSCHTRSFSNEEMHSLAERICMTMRDRNVTDVEIIMDTPGWQENQHSDYLGLVDDTFRHVLGFSPRKVAMHFVLEAGYYVQKFPGIEIACIGPRIIEPHSTKERVELSTVDNIYKVLIELLKRLA